MDYKKSVSRALQNYHSKQLNQGLTREPKRKNKKPEKEVEKQVLEWAKENKVHLHVIEASSYDPRLGRKGRASAQSGFPDLVGNTREGHSVYIELKAKDRRGNVSGLQRIFLENKINESCFAVVVDSRTRLEQYWRGYWVHKGAEERKTYLTDCLPKKRKRVNDDPLFD